ncbi:STAS domain-containing protein [Tautonia sp. JC769]|uniref:STAS domain-containing protein n=1 Tax=Tautonia sp. JC769 TaxID=3232135 RepID=UPI003459DA4B
MSIAPTGSVEDSYRIREDGGIVRIEILTPRLPEELGEVLLGEAVLRHWASMVIDCSRVEFLSSLGLGALIRLDRQLRPTGGRLRLSGLNAHLREFFSITRLDRVLLISDDEADSSGRPRSARDG